MLIAIKEDDRVIMGYACTTNLINTHTEDITDADNLGIWRIKSAPTALFGCTATCYGADLLRYDEELFKDGLSYSALVKTVMPGLKKRLADKGFVADKKRMPQEILVADGNRLYTLTQYFAVLPRDNYVVQGMYSEIAEGMLDGMQGSAEERIINTLRALGKTVYWQFMPVIIMDTKGNTQIYYE